MLKKNIELTQDENEFPHEKFIEVSMNKKEDSRNQIWDSSNYVEIEMKDLKALAKIKNWKKDEKPNANLDDTIDADN